MFYRQSDSGPFWMSTSTPKEECQHDKQLGATTDVVLQVKILLEMIDQLSVTAGVSNTLGESTRQLKGPCLQHRISACKAVPNSIEGNLSE